MAIFLCFRQINILARPGQMSYHAQDMADNTPQQPDYRPYFIIALLGLVVAWQSMKAGEALGDSFIGQLGLLFALGALYIAIRGILRARANRKPALPAAPAEFHGSFAPDFRRNLAALHAALGKGNPEMTLEEDYAFWYNTDQALEVVLTPTGWLAFFQICDGEHHMEPELVQRAVADSPFATHTVAQELVQKYSDMPLSGIAWCTAETMQVYPYTTTEDFTLLYANNLFAPAASFDQWLPFYLATGMMNEV